MPEYLTILLVVLIVTVFIEFKYHIHLYHSRKERLFVTLNIFLFGMFWDYFAVYRQHWIFPGDGLIGIRIFGLPIEEFLFFLIIPYAALVMYKFYDTKIK
ncbi:MAG: Lycopene cyclase [Parcubacteria group bacterium GW2011_GWB1_36_5]|nr:MAG: Lycopene cyclase [Parcubacteria group bacterium GW2011_GWB1_36_5]